MIVDDFGAIKRRLDDLHPDPWPDGCPLPSERDTEYRRCWRACGRVVHGTVRECDGSCHIAETQTIASSAGGQTRLTPV